MGKGASWSQEILALLLQAVTAANIAQNASSAPITNIYISLHTASPTGGAGLQTTNEATYTGYARVAVPRTTGGWSVVNGVASPLSNIAFPVASAGTETETYFGVGTAATGTGELLYYGTISPFITIATGIQPVLTTATTITET